MITDAQRQMMNRVLGRTGGRQLKRGARGVTVRALQLYLRDQGHDIKADGIFGPKTEAALKAMQGKAGIGADGRAGSKTFRIIRDSISVPMPTPRPSTDTETASATESVDMPPPMPTVGLSEPLPLPEPQPQPQPSQEPLPAAAPAEPPMPETEPAPLAQGQPFFPPQETPMTGPGGSPAPRYADSAIASILTQALPGIYRQQPVPEISTGNSPLASGIDAYNPDQIAAPPIASAPTGFQDGQTFAPPQPGDGLDALRAALIGKINAGTQQAPPPVAQQPGDAVEHGLIRALLMRAGY